VADDPAAREKSDSEPDNGAENSNDSAGAASPHLDHSDKKLAAAHTAPRALVIHELVREEGEEGLKRPAAALAWSGFAAGLSMGFSFLSLALLHSGLPDAPWRKLVESPGYRIGFLIVILGRQQLFTETTVTAVLPLLIRRNLQTFVALLRFWVIVLLANVAGAIVFAGLITPAGLFPPEVHQALLDIGRESVNGAFWPTMVRSVFAGWLIALMVWILPSARSARMFVILIITYIVSVGHFSHTVAGTVEAAFAVFAGNSTLHDFLFGFMTPTLIGNTIGGVALVALLNHAPLAAVLQGESQDRN
jgi:formate/nitrite transporter FocA (FNT family)